MTDIATLSVRLDPTVTLNDGTQLEVLGTSGTLPEIGDTVARKDAPDETREVTSVGDFGRPHGYFAIEISEPFGEPGYYSPALTAESNLDLVLIPA